MTIPLRAKYIRDLAIRGRAERTQQSYSRYVSELARYTLPSFNESEPEEIMVHVSTGMPNTGGILESDRHPVVTAAENPVDDSLL